MTELISKLNQLKDRLGEVRTNLNPEEKEREAKELEASSTDPAFWQDEEHARKIMKQLATLREEINAVSGIGKAITDAEDIIKLSTESGDTSLTADLETSLRQIAKDLNLLEINTFLSGKYDREDAIVSIHAGQGGTEAMDWAQMLFRMYTRYVELQEKWRYELVDETVGDEAGIKSATIIVHGPFAYGYLKKEAGTHRLVRQSPFNADNLRQTSFALVEVLPHTEDTADDIIIRDEDLEWQFYRSGGKGGQNVNKVNTAVRLKHIPTGIVVASQAQRYQEQNRKIALSLLKAKLRRLEDQEKEATLAKLKGGNKMASWGTQIRSYVLHPYKLVKDLRTEVESTDPEGVLDGKLTNFIEAEIKTKL